MKSFDTDAIQPEYFRLFNAARQEMFKAELLQDYSKIDDCASLRAWLAGDKEESKRIGLDRSYIDHRNQCLASPAKITRVHVIDEPLTPYLEWEIEILYKGSLLKFGAENVMLVPRSKLKGAKLPPGDFWIFDNKFVLEWKFNNGNPAGGNVYDESDDINQFLQLKEVLLAAATPV